MKNKMPLFLNILKCVHLILDSVDYLNKVQHLLA